MKTIVLFCDRNQDRALRIALVFLISILVCSLMYDSLIFAPPRWSFKSSPELSNEEEDGPRKKRSLLFENLLSGIAWLLNNGGGYSLSPS
jgi:hypothetical protein